MNTTLFYVVKANGIVHAMFNKSVVQDRLMNYTTDYLREKGYQVTVTTMEVKLYEDKVQSNG